MARQKVRKNGRMVWVEVAEYDPNPLYCPENSAAFDPRYGPATEEQIEWHRKRGCPGAETWEVGQPARPFHKT